MSDLFCLVGLGQCLTEGLNPTLYSGGLLRYYELLSLIGIILAGYQFLESDRLRRYLFVRYKNRFILSITIPALFLFISYSIPLLPGDAVPLIGYPYFWKLLSLLIITCVLGFFLLFSFYYNTESWIVKYSSRKKAKTINDIGYFAIYIDGSEEAYKAFCRILSTNLKLICQTAALYNSYIYRNQVDGKKFTDAERKDIFKESLRENGYKSELVQLSLDLFEMILPDTAFCTYIVEKDYHLLNDLYELAESNKLWNSTGHDFFRTLSSILFSIPKSPIKKELANDGYYKGKWLFRTITTSPGIMSNYDIIDSDFIITDDNRDIIHKLGQSVLGFYFSNTAHQNYGIQNRVNRLLEKIIDRFSYYKDTDDFDSSVGHFIGSIPDILVYGTPYKNDEITMSLGHSEENFSRGSVLDNIVDLVFDRFEVLLRKNQEYWYHNSINYWWIIWPDSSTYEDNTNVEVQAVFNKIRNKFLEKIIDRISREKMPGFGDKNRIIRMLLTVLLWKINQSHFKDHSIIALWVESQMNSVWGPQFLSDEEFRLTSLPSGFLVQDGKIIDSGHFGNRQVYPPIVVSTKGTTLDDTMEG